MTFEEIQQTLEQMLSVQRQLQESQIGLTQRLSEYQETFDQQLTEQRQEFNRWVSEMREDHARFNERLDRLATQSDRQERILDRLIGYSLSNETEHLNLEERMNALEQRVRRLDEQS